MFKYRGKRYVIIIDDDSACDDEYDSAAPRVSMHQGGLEDSPLISSCIVHKKRGHYSREGKKKRKTNRKKV